MKKVLTALAATTLSTAAMANPFDIGATLYGDPREGNPNGLEVSVFGSVNGDTGSFTVDLSPMIGVHDDVKMKNFYLNLAGDAADYSFSNFTPDWAVTATEVTNPTGGGAAFAGTQFLFELGDPPPGAGNDVTTAIPLTFDITDLVDDFTEADFAGAPIWSSNDVVLGGGQMGAHLQSLTVNDITCPEGLCDSDSGFAVGDWGGGTGTGGPEPISEPGMLGLLSMGLVGLFYSRRKNRYAA